MKITGLKVHILESKPNPIQETTGYVGARDASQHGLARILTDEGIEGHAFFHIPLGLRSLSGSWAIARKDLEGQDPLDRAKIEHAMSAKYSWSHVELRLLDVCLWDIAGKAMGQPVYKLLGASREKIPAYASTMHHRTDRQFIEEALECKKKGFKALKIHPYCSPDDDLRLCRALRKAVGDEMILMMDTLIYPGPYSRRDALRVGRVLDELNFYWFEDPLPKTDLDGLAELCRSLETRILMGERVSSFSEYTQFIDRHATDILRGNLSMGGITGVLKIAHLAEAHNMNIEIHSFFGALEPASLHAMLAINNSDYYEQSVPEGVFDERMYPGVFKDVIRIDDNGYVHAPKKPGLGYDIDLGQVEKVTVERLSS